MTMLLISLILYFGGKALVKAAAADPESTGACERQTSDARPHYHFTVMTEEKEGKAESSGSCITALPISAKQRAINKLLGCNRGPQVVAVLDALLDIRPRRTEPAATEVVILRDHVFLNTDKTSGEHIGTLDDLIQTILGISDACELTDDERSVLLKAVEDAKIDRD